MDQQQPEGGADSAAAGNKTEWTAPLVDKLVAGGAEANAGNDVEGIDGIS